MTRLAILALLLVPAWGQLSEKTVQLNGISITATRQHPAIAAQYLGAKLPKGLAVYRVDACAETADSVSPDWVIHQLSSKLAVQDGAFAQHAAEIFKANGVWPRLGAAVGKVAPKAMGVAAGFLTANPYAGVGVTFAIEHIVESGARRGTLEVPANWYRASAETARLVPLGPRGCLPAMLVAVDGKADGIVRVEVDELAARPGRVAAMVREKTAGGLE